MIDRAWQRKVDDLLLRNQKLTQEVERWQRFAIHAWDCPNVGETACNVCDELWDEAMRRKAHA